MKDQMSLDELLEELSGVTESKVMNDLGVEASTDIKVVKEEIAPEQKEITFREKSMNILKDYEEVIKENSDLAKRIEDLQATLRELHPDIFEQIDAVNATISSNESRLKQIASEACPIFEGAINEDEENKTLVYGKVQGTYVYPTEKHSFDLKSFIEENKEFYTENISILDPYAKITPVSAYVKFTVKKGK